jgi:hypothetical protein
MRIPLPCTLPQLTRRQKPVEVGTTPESGPLNGKTAEPPLLERDSQCAIAGKENRDELAQEGFMSDQKDVLWRTVRIRNLPHEALGISSGLEMLCTSKKPLNPQLVYNNLRRLTRAKIRTGQHQVEGELHRLHTRRNGMHFRPPLTGKRAKAVIPKPRSPPFDGDGMTKDIEIHLRYSSDIQNP